MGTAGWKNSERKLFTINGGPFPLLNARTVVQATWSTGVVHSQDEMVAGMRPAHFTAAAAAAHRTAILNALLFIRHGDMVRLIDGGPYPNRWVDR